MHIALITNSKSSIVSHFYHSSAGKRRQLIEWTKAADSLYEGPQVAELSMQLDTLFFLSWALLLITSCVGEQEVQFYLAELIRPRRSIVFHFKNEHPKSYELEEFSPAFPCTFRRRPLSDLMSVEIHFSVGNPKKYLMSELTRDLVISSFRDPAVLAKGPWIFTLKA